MYELAEELTAAFSRLEPSMQPVLLIQYGDDAQNQLKSSSTQQNNSTINSIITERSYTPYAVTGSSLRSDEADEIVSSEKKEDFTKSLKIIGKQIKQIENLVNEFSDFARMPKPILKDNNLVPLINDNINLISQLDNSISINFDVSSDNVVLNSDNEQLSRVFFNMLKNSIESIQEKKIKNNDFKGKIDIILIDTKFDITFIIIDNGLGFEEFANNIKNILNPYFTTKEKGTGLGLAIVNKIINDHNGSIKFIPIMNGAKIKILFIK